MDEQKPVGLQAGAEIPPATVIKPPTVTEVAKDKPPTDAELKAKRFEEVKDAFERMWDGKIRRFTVYKKCVQEA